MMKKTLHRSVLAGMAALSMSTWALAAPVVVTPGSNAGYLYFPSAGKSGGSGTEPGIANVSLDAMQVATTQCYTSSGTVTLPAGFTTGYIQAIVVAGGNGGQRYYAGSPGAQVLGQPSSVSHAEIGTVTAQPGAGSGGGGYWRNSSFGQFGAGGGGGGYLGSGGDGFNGGGGGGASGGGGGFGATPAAGDEGYSGGAGQGAGFGGSVGQGGGKGAYPGSQGAVLPIPGVILCPSTPVASHGAAKGGTGYGAGKGALEPDRGGDAGGIATVVWKYTTGTITVVVGAGGSGNAGQGAPGVVALRFIPQ